MFAFEASNDETVGNDGQQLSPTSPISQQSSSRSSDSDLLAGLLSNLETKPDAADTNDKNKATRTQTQTGSST